MCGASFFVETGVFGSKLRPLLCTWSRHLPLPLSLSLNEMAALLRRSRKKWIDFPPLYSYLTFICRQIRFARRWCNIFCFSQLYTESSRFCTISGICFPGQENERTQWRLQYSWPVSGVFVVLCYLWFTTIISSVLIYSWCTFLLLLSPYFNSVSVKCKFLHCLG